jgi:hypothetical protein
MAQDNRVEDLIQRVAREYDDLSKQLKLIAQYITEHRQQMVVVRIRDVADACGVQPSAVVRFCPAFRILRLLGSASRLSRRLRQRHLRGPATISDCKR